MSRLTENLERLERFGVLNRYHMNILENNLEEYNEEIRNKAIDEFAEEAMKQFTDFDLEHGYPTVADCKGILMDVAKQMKGGKNE